MASRNELPSTDQDGAAAPDGPGNAPAATCAPCVGSCVPETIRFAGTTDGRLVVTSKALFHSGTFQHDQQALLESKLLWVGGLEPNAIDKLAAVQATTAFSFEWDGKETLLVRDYAADGSAGFGSLQLDPATGAVVAKHPFGAIV